MTEEDAFLAAICSEPDDDTVRLVFADWLDEHDRSERAEFIRIGIESDRIGAENLPGCGPLCKSTQCHRSCPSRVVEAEQKDRRERERELLSGHDGAHKRQSNAFGWAESITDSGILLGRLWPDRLVYRRGFPDELTLSAQDWLTHADKLVWNPTQTVECPKCDGCGIHDARNGWPSCCRVCGGKKRVQGTGRIDRPYKPGAQPIRKVTLTTMPVFEPCYPQLRVRLQGYSRTSHAPHERPMREIAEELFKFEWPWIEFVFPPEPMGTTIAANPNTEPIWYNGNS